ncbi:MAG: UDP-N-acetylmuramate--L-alanine ligase [Chloroflexi bacterium]|nr:UDP-N-acetylmuramate--L-alanine ligase [Chloroflexota bacterium]MBP7043746.1 UDP-N-acetylmuramate--L-alanine ligase [Chloroflexota bacterium]
MITDFKLRNEMHIHLVGIGGSGISAIARVLLGRGFVVSGSDMQANEFTAVLATEGATIFQGHRTENIAGADALVISSAVPDDNPEVAAARAQGIPVLKRADLLGHLMADKIGVAVAGSHGKTTTTGMIAQILLQADLDPTVIVGGTLPSIEGNGRYGQGDYFVIEADEYDHMFLGLRPEVAIITSIEHDHPDLFPTEADYVGAFREFVGLLPDGGRLIACADDPGILALLHNLALTDVEITTYALADEETAVSADFKALDCRPNQLGGMDFVVEEDGQLIGLARLRVPGLHNVRNALAAIIVSLDLGIDFSIIRQGLAEFGGMGRRFQVLGEVGRVTVIDDYAHHPTEIQATLAAARQRFPGRRLWAVWQPHTYSRTRLLAEQFAKSFDQADRVIALDIYRSREQDTLGMDTSVIINAMDHPHAIHIPDRRAAADYLLDRVRPDDVILTLGAGDGNMVGQWVLEGLSKRVQS